MAGKVGPGWFAVILYREPTNTLRPSEQLHDFRVEDALPIFDGILRASGQTVPIGHPEMTALPERDGLMDRAADELILQAAAVSHARFLMEL